MLFITTFLLAALVVGIGIRATRTYNRQKESLLAMFSRGNRVRDRLGREYVVTESDTVGFVFLRPSKSAPTLRLVDLMTPAGTYRTSLLQDWTPA
jgi:hypothetical protein